MTRLVFSLMGAYKKFGLSKLEKKLFIKDKAAFQKSLEKMSHWDFDRIIVSHGNNIDQDGKKRFFQAYF